MIKQLLIFLVILSISIPIADAIPLSDKTGLKFTFPVKTDGHSFVIYKESDGHVYTLQSSFGKAQLCSIPGDIFTNELVETIESASFKNKSPRNRHEKTDRT